MPTKIKELDALLTKCRSLTKPGGSAQMKVTQAFLDRAQQEPAVLAQAAGVLAQAAAASGQGDAPGAADALPPHGAAWLALVLGMAVEDGADPALTAPGVVGLFLAWVEQLPEVQDEEDEDESEDGDAALNAQAQEDQAAEDAAEEADDDGDEGYDDDDDEDSDGPPWMADLTPAQRLLCDALPQLCQSTVAHLARLPQERERLSRDADLDDHLERTEPYSHAIGWVLETLRRRSGTLLLLHPASGAGWRIAYENIGSNFHLFSLIQHALAMQGVALPGAHAPDEHIAQAVLGNFDEDFHDGAWWHYGAATSPTPQLTHSIWGEGSPLEIPEVEGERIILLWPMLLQSRGWGGGFCGVRIEATPPGISLVETLTAEQARGWLGKIGVEAGA